MTKRIIFLLIILTFLLSACSIGGDNPNVQNTENDQNTNDQNLVENSDEPDADDPEYSPSSSVATCVASSAPQEISLELYDKVKGATEDYKITIIEYGDFQ